VLDFVWLLGEACDDAADFVLFVADLESAAFEADDFELVFSVELFAAGLLALDEGSVVAAVEL
jgi:hypothetical protein